MARATFNGLGRRLGAALAFTLLSACAATGYQASSFTLIVEGNEASYPAFEAAAKACGYTAYRRFPGATVGSVTVGPHYNLSRVDSRAAMCAIQWVDQHPETGLILSGE